MSHHGNVGSLVEKKERLEPPKYTVDREATCPMLLRVFCSTSRHNSMSEYMKGDRHRDFLFFVIEYCHWFSSMFR